MTLTHIAADMHAAARRTGAAVRELSGGLRVELVVAGGQTVFTLSRPATPPTEQEVSVCRFHFSVPSTAQRRDSGNLVEFRWEGTR